MDQNVLDLCALSTENRRVHFQNLTVPGVDSVPDLWGVAMKSVEKTEIYRMCGGIGLIFVFDLRCLPVECVADNLQKERDLVDFDRSIVVSAAVAGPDVLVAFAARVAVVFHAPVVAALARLAAFAALFLAAVVVDVFAFVARRVVAVV